MKTSAMLRHSYLNIFRNARSTVMILFILSASAIILFVTNCFLEQMYRGMRMGFMNQSGFLQIAGKGFWDPASEKNIIISTEQMASIRKTLNKYPEIAGVNRELSFQGIIGTEKRSSIISGMGIEAGKQGGYAGYVLIQTGVNLEKTDAIGILIGKPVAEKLMVNAGDYVNIMTGTVDNSLNIASAQVVGTVSTAMDQADAYFAVANLPFVQELRNVDGVDRVLLFLRDEENIPAMKEQLARDFKATGLPIEVRTWEELNKFYFDLKGLYDGLFYFIITIISVLVFLAVMQIISMSFFERFREIGTIRAIGNTKREVFFMLLGESVIYFFVSITLAAIIGIALGTFLNSLDLSWRPPGASRAVPFRFFVRPRFMLLPAAVVFIASFFAVLFPAMKSAGKQIVDVLNHE